MMNRSIFTTFSLLFLLFFQPTTAQNQATPQTSSPEAALRLAHLVPEAQDVTVLIDGTLVFQGVTSGLVTGYTLVGAGEHQVVLMPVAAETTGAETAGTGATGGAGAAPLAAVTVTTEAGSYYTVVVTEAADEAADEATAGATTDDASDATGGAPVPGVVAQAIEPADPSGDLALELITFTDTLGDFPPAGEALLRVVHVSPDAPAATLVAAPEGSQGVASETNNDPAALQAIQGTALVTNLPFGNSSPYTPFAADTYHFQIQTANGVAVLDLPDTLIEAGTVYTVYVSGRSASTLTANVSVDALVSQVLE